MFIKADSFLVLCGFAAEVFSCLEYDNWLELGLSASSIAVSMTTVPQMYNKSLWASWKTYVPGSAIKLHHLSVTILLKMQN